ncbi:MAG: hypothetical protein IKN29_04315 [Bacteroidales bacterium]|nr:hypothetical protein [Bacteroidales bacterium]
MKKILVAAAIFTLFSSLALRAQSGLYLPTTKPVKDMRAALTNPQAFYLLLSYQGSDSTYNITHLDLLDSAYRIAFSEENPMLYTMVVESYGGADETLGNKRVEAVVRYFSKRCHSLFPIRYARNPIHCSCHGDSVETIRFEVPTATAVYDCATLPSERLKLNKSIDLTNSVLVTFRNNPDECIGSARGCYVPAVDSLVRGYYAQLFLARGSVYSVSGTKDTCPSDIQIKVDDHLDYRTTVERYSLIPHPKQILVQAGYVVVSSNYARTLDECEEPQKDSIFIRIPATPEQVAAKLKFFARVKTSRGIEYKALPTRKMPGKGELMLQAPINVAQFDTIYLGKRISEKELKDYFFEVDSPTEAASFAVGNRFFVAYRVDKHGSYELRKDLRDLFRIVPDQEEDLQPREEKRKNVDPDEIIE